MCEMHLHKTSPCPWGLRAKQSERCWLLGSGQSYRRDGRAIWEPWDPGKRTVWRGSRILFRTYSMKSMLHPPVLKTPSYPQRPLSRSSPGFCWRKCSGDNVFSCSYSFLFFCFGNLTHSSRFTSNKSFSRRVDFLLMLQGWKNGSPQQALGDLFIFFLLNVNVLEQASSCLPVYPACLGHNHTSVLPALVL